MKMKPPASSNSPISRKKPRVMPHLISAAVRHYRGGGGNSTSSVSYRRHTTGTSGPFGGRNALTLRGLPSIRAPMAAGAIPPPLFFERRRQVGPRLGSRPGNDILGNRFK